MEGTCMFGCPILCPTISMTFITAQLTIWQIRQYNNLPELGVVSGGVEDGVEGAGDGVGVHHALHLQYSTVQYSTVHHALHLAAASLPRLPRLPPPPPVLPPPLLLLLQVAVVTVRVAAQHSAPAHITTAKNLHLATTKNIYNSNSEAKKCRYNWTQTHRGRDTRDTGRYIQNNTKCPVIHSNTLLVKYIYLSMSTLHIVWELELKYLSCWWPLWQLVTGRSCLDQNTATNDGSIKVLFYFVWGIFSNYLVCAAGVTGVPVSFFRTIFFFFNFAAF